MSRSTSAPGCVDVGFGGGDLLRKPLFATAPRLGEGGRAAQKPLAEDLYREACRRDGGGSSPLAIRLLMAVLELGECATERDLLWGEREHKRLGLVSGAELGRVRAGVDLALQAPHHDLLDALSLWRGLSRIGLAEAYRVKDLEQPGEAARVAVVRRGAQEQAVLELRRDTDRSMRQRSLSSPKAEGMRLWHSSTIRRSQGEMRRAFRRSAGPPGTGRGRRSAAGSDTR